VAIVGAGGLGCPLAQYLAAAGVGGLTLIDDDVVDASNLQRQILFGTADIGRPKVGVAEERVRAQNPDVDVRTHRVRLDSTNALDLFAGHDVVIDGTDNFPTRYLTNDACVMLGIPNVYGSIFRFDGQAGVFDARNGPCYRCLYPEPPPPGSVPSCAEGGVLGVLPGIIALIQATETVKLLAGIGRTLVGRLLLYDALSMEFTEFTLKKDPGCPVCGEAPTVTELIDYDGFCGLPAPGEQTPRHVPAISAAELARRRAGGDELLLLDVRDPDEFERARIEGATLVPLGELAERVDELAPWRGRAVVVHCHHGRRSELGARTLMDAGFEHVEHLDGGIEAWSLTVDPSVPRY
jgi:adenylyltransferase/sulfurtransferase